MKYSIAAGLAAGALAALLPLSAATAAGAGVIVVPDDFVPALSDTRATGHYELTPAGLHIWTEGATSTDKVAEYVCDSFKLADVGEPSLAWTGSSPQPGFQLVTDFDADGAADGILVGEPTFYGTDWWASNGSAQFVKDRAPSHESGSGSANHGTLAQWRAEFPTAVVPCHGFSLGSGVKGDGVIASLTIAGIVSTFVAPTPPLPDCEEGEEAQPTDGGYVCGPADPATPGEEPAPGVEVPVAAPDVVTAPQAAPRVLAETGPSDTLMLNLATGGLVLCGLGVGACIYELTAKRRRTHRARKP